MDNRRRMRGRRQSSKERVLLRVGMQIFGMLRGMLMEG
jgi:hypothetical protein